jgi:hypothetical protein
MKVSRQPTNDANDELNEATEIITKGGSGCLWQQIRCMTSSSAKVADICFCKLRPAGIRSGIKFFIEL